MYGTSSLYLWNLFLCNHPNAFGWLLNKERPNFAAQPLGEKIITYSIL